MIPSIRKRSFIEGQNYLLEDLRRAGVSERVIDSYTYPAGRYVRFRFCGFFSTSNDVFIVFPKAHVLPDSHGEIAEQVRVLAGALLRYRQEGSIDEQERTLLGADGHEPEGSIATALLILEDYRNYGLLIRDRQVEQRNGKGRIHWGRTVNRALPVFSGEAPFYFDTVTRYRDRQSKDLIVLLHQHVIATCLKKYGWILDPTGFNENLPTVKMPCSKERADFLLRQELSQCFRDREIKLVKLLHSFIVGTSSKDAVSRIRTFGTTYFFNVWEAACCYVLRHRKEYQELVPRPQWVRIVADRESVEETRQIPDILYLRGAIRYVLDAKYYTQKRSLPGWGDLVKQFFYAKTIFCSETGGVRNGMLFPGHHEEQLVRYMGYAHIPEHGGLGRIHGFTLNTFSVLNDYYRYCSFGYRKALEDAWPEEG